MYLCCLWTLLLSYEKVKHLVEVDEKILAVFTINSHGNISDIFIAPDANIDRSFIKIIGSKLDFKFEAIDKATTTTIEEGTQEGSRTQMVGKHLGIFLNMTILELLRFMKPID